MKNLLILLTIVFLFPSWKKSDFGKKIITYIQILLQDQQLCDINGGPTTQYFNLERGACQSDTVLAYLFILLLESLFPLIKKCFHKKMYRSIWALLTLYGKCRWYVFFLEIPQSIGNLVEIFNIVIPFFLDWNQIWQNVKILGVGTLKKVQGAVCGMRCIDLCNEAIKMLDTYFSYNNRIKEEWNFLKIASKVPNQGLFGSLETFSQ